MNIGIVNDVSMICAVLKKIIHEKSEHTIIWTAADGNEAIEKAKKFTPDLILMDLIMPKMDGVDATKEIMQSSPCAIVIVTASVDQNADMVFSAMSYGALDAISTPTLSSTAGEQGIDQLLHKLSMIERLVSAQSIKQSHNPLLTTSKKIKSSRFPIVCIGASTGGPGALDIVLSGLPADLGVAIVIVQHVDKDFTPGLADWLNSHCQLDVCVADEGLEIEKNKVCIVGGDEHAVLDENHCFYYTPEPTNLFYRPSIDVFFHSVLNCWTAEKIGVVLTGMGNDGAEGMLAFKNNNFYTIAQDEETSAVYGMPMAVAELNAANKVLAIDAIAAEIIKQLR